jgi:hypothetical protein
MKAQSLTCSARLRLQAQTVPRADSMLSEFPAVPPTPSPTRERERGAISSKWRTTMVVLHLLKHQK